MPRNSTPSAAISKPATPDGSPLFAHANGYWAKKIDGKFVYFGRWKAGVSHADALERFAARGQQPAPPAKVETPRHVVRVAADFPLRARSNGQFGRKVKIDGRWVWKNFGAIKDPAAALVRYQEFQRSQPDQTEGPRQVTASSATVQDLFDYFLDLWEARQAAGQVSRKQVKQYEHTTQQFAAVIPPSRTLASLQDKDWVRLRADWAARYKKVNLKNMMTRILTIFGRSKKLLPAGFEVNRSCFEKPSLRELRVEKAEGYCRVFEPATLRRLIKEADQELKAQILLGINAGLYPVDCEKLPRAAIDLDAGWLRYHRNKTGHSRRCPLWPETVAACREWLAIRDDAGETELAELFFCVKGTPEQMTSGPGRAFHHPQGKIAWVCAKDRVDRRFAALVKRLKLDKEHLCFSMLRHTFATVGDMTGDRAALRTIMGHEGGSITDYYIHDSAANSPEWSIQQHDRARLMRVVKMVRRWLYGARKEGKTRKEKAAAE